MYVPNDLNQKCNHESFTQLLLCMVDMSVKKSDGGQLAQV